MKKEDYKRVVSSFKADNAFETRLRQRVLKVSGTKTKNTKPLYRRPITILAAICIIVFITGIPMLQNIFGKANTQATSKSINSESHSSIFSGFMLTAYAASSEQVSLTGNFRKDTVPTILTPGAEVMLPEYSPLMSSVPGLPFVINCSAAKDNEFVADEIQVTVDKGKILLWDQNSGAIEDKEKSVVCKVGETIYWSPISSGSSVKDETSMKLRAMKDGKEVGTKIIVIKALDSIIGKYSATASK